MGNKSSSRKWKHSKSQPSNANPQNQTSTRNSHQTRIDKTTGILPPSRTLSLNGETNQALVGNKTDTVPAMPNPDSHLSVHTVGRMGAPGSRGSSRSSFHQQHSNGESVIVYTQLESPETKYGGGLFANASNMKFDHPILAEHVHGDINQYYFDSNILEKMKNKHVTLEAEFDSSDREYAPRCHPGTRLRFLEELKERIRSRTRITWLFGPAGVGKSAIMQTLAETLSSPPTPSIICLSFFFSRPNKRNDPRKVFPTLAYRLAIANPEYRRYLEENLSRDPDFLAKTLDEQFRRLFIDPITTRRVNNFPPCAMFLDGLDEADGSPAQCRILELIQGFVERDRNSSIPIFWIIASRPEPHLQTSFSEIEEKVSDDFWKLEIPIDSDEAARDVEIYIRASFLKIRKAFSDVIPSPWPPEADLLKITATSNGLFVFGTTCMVYIGDEYPVERLSHIVALINHYREGSEKGRPDLPRNPFEILDALYRTILKSISTDTLPTTRAILGFHLLGGEITGTPSFDIACRILGYEPPKARAALRGLHSVLRCPPQDKPQDSLQFLHASFSDFLRDRSRSQEQWIDMAEELRGVWRCYVRVFRWFTETVLPDLIPLDDGSCFQRMLEDGFLSKFRKYNWLRVLTTHCHALPCNCGVSYHLILDTSELVGVFEEFSRVLFCPEAKFWFDPQVVVDWLFGTSKNVPLALLEHIYHETMTLDRFTEPYFDCVFRGLNSGRSATHSHPGSHFMKVNTKGVSNAEWENIKHRPVTAHSKYDLPELETWKVLGQLMCLEKESQTKYTVRIFGIREHDLWVAISGKFKGFKKRVCLVFPYIELAYNE